VLYVTIMRHLYVSFAGPIGFLGLTLFNRSDSFRIYAREKMCGKNSAVTDALQARQCGSDEFMIDGIIVMLLRNETMEKNGRSRHRCWEKGAYPPVSSSSYH